MKYPINSIGKGNPGMIRKKHFRVILPVLLITAFSLGSFSCGIGTRYEKKEEVEYRINPSGKDKIVLDNFGGTVTVQKGDSASGIVIKAEITDRVKKKDLDKPLKNISIGLDTSGNVVRIESSSRKSFSFNFSFDFKSPHINYVLTVPPGIKLTVNNANGRVSVDEFSDELEVSLTNGSVKAANVTGKSQFDITNGNFDGSLDSTKGFKVDVVNGNVNLKLGTSFKGEITANVVNGRVKHEGLTFSAVDEDKKSLKGYIGNRDWDVNLEVVNGRINLEGRQ